MRIALTIACAVACGALIHAEHARRATLRVIAKLVASTAFVAIGTAAFEVGHDPARVHYAQTIFLGLVLGAIGDVALLGHSSRAFLAGLGAFLLGHLAYVVAIGAVVEPPAPGSPARARSRPCRSIAGAVALALLWPRLGRDARAGDRVRARDRHDGVAALAAWRDGRAARAAADAPGRRRRCCSSSRTSRSRETSSSAPRFVNKLWGLPAYYAGQLLIAWSLAGLCADRLLLLLAAALAALLLRRGRACAPPSSSPSSCDP